MHTLGIIVGIAALIIVGVVTVLVIVMIGARMTVTPWLPIGIG